MTRLEPTPSSPPAEPAAGAYVGYRSPGLSAAVRLPSGEHAVLGADGGAGVRLAEVVLSDRLGRAPGSHLLDAFCREWVQPFRRGEFVWPVEAVDEWLAAATRRLMGKPLTPHPIPLHAGAL